MSMIEICDICGKPLGNGSHMDASGHLWPDISMEEKKYRSRAGFMGSTWTKYLSICGHCRAQLAKYDEEKVHIWRQNKDSNPSEWYYDYYCSNCGFKIKKNQVTYKFCPNCGVKMGIEGQK